MLGIVIIHCSCGVGNRLFLASSSQQWLTAAEGKTTKEYEYSKDGLKTKEYTNIIKD